MTIADKLERLNRLRPLSPESCASLAAAWDTRMVYESNAIEGSSLTLRETDIVLSKGLTVSGKPLRDHLDAVNLQKAWEQVKQLAKPSVFLNENIVCDLHALVLADGGSYRTSAVRISGSGHVPPNPVKVPDQMEQLFSKLGAFSEPLKRAAFLHHQISSIHPFTDGNRRLARLAMNFIFLQAGYPPVSIPPQDRPRIARTTIRPWKVRIAEICRPFRRIWEPTFTGNSMTTCRLWKTYPFPIKSPDQPPFSTNLS